MSKYKSLDVNKDILFACNKKIDPRVIKEKDTGGKSKSRYISGHTCIALLNEIFGSTWSFEVEKEWMEEGVTFFKKDWNNTLPDDKVTVNEKGDRGTYVPQNPVFWCKGVLTVYLKDEETNEMIQIKKTGYGSQALTGDQSSQANNGFKGAQTDALKKAATLFGIGGELYRNEEEQEHFDELFDMQLTNREQTDEEKELIEESTTLAAKCNKNPSVILKYCSKQVTSNTTDDINKLPKKYIVAIINEIKKRMNK